MASCSYCVINYVNTVWVFLCFEAGYVCVCVKADLIHLGAKYSPCMRRDENVERAIADDRLAESQTACCIRNDQSGCVQASRSNCSVSWLFAYISSLTCACACCLLVQQDDAFCSICLS